MHTHFTYTDFDLNDIVKTQNVSDARDRMYKNKTKSEDNDIYEYEMINKDEFTQLAQRNDISMFDETVSSENETDIDINTSKMDSTHESDDNGSIITGLTPFETGLEHILHPQQSVESSSSNGSVTNGLNTSQPSSEYVSKTREELETMKLEDFEQHCINNANALQRSKNYRPFGVSWRLFCIRR